MFNITDMNRCAGVYTCEKFPSFCAWASPKNCPWKRYFGWGACHQRTAQTAQFQMTEIISGASQHPKDVPFV